MSSHMLEIRTTHHIDGSQGDVYRIGTEEWVEITDLTYSAARQNLDGTYEISIVDTPFVRINELEADIIRRKVINTISRERASIDPTDPTVIEAWRETCLGWKSRAESAEAELAKLRRSAL